MLRKRILTLGICTVALVALSAGPAMARETVTETCASGLVFVVDAHAEFGITTANEIYNEVNPGDDFCTLG